MTFIQSIFLYGLFTAALPLLIHLFSRRKKVRIDFSSLYFLKLLESKRIRYVKLRRYLLLLTRMLIAALLALAFARPALTGPLGSQISDDTPVAAVIILDNSLSGSAEADGGSVFAQAKQQALEILDSFKDGDELWFFVTSETDDAERIRPVYEVDAVRSRIRTAEVTSGSVDLGAALQAGRQILETGVGLHREVFLVSDLQASNFQGVVSESPAGDVAHPIRFYLVSPNGGLLENSGITDAVIRNQILEKGKQFTLRATVRNFGDEAVRDMLVSLYFDGQRIAQDNVSLEAGTAENIDFQVIPERAGIIEGTVEIEDDRLSEDNRRHFIARIPETIPLLLINGNPEAQVFLESVYSHELADPIDAHVISDKEITTVDFKDYDVIVFNGFTVFSDSDIYRIQNFCSGGGGVVIYPSILSDPASFNRTIGRSLALPQITGFSGLLQDAGDPDRDFLLVEEVDLEHALFSNMYREGTPEPDLPSVFVSLDMVPGRNSRTVMKLSNGKPLLVENRVGQGAVLIFSSAPSLSWNTMPLKGMFAPLLYRTVQYLSASDGYEQAPRLVNEPVSFLYTGSIDDLAMISPAGESYSLNPTVSSDAYRIEFLQTSDTGIYRFTQGGRELKKFAVNPDPSESDLHPVADGRLGLILADSDYYYWAGADNLDEKIAETRYGREISRYFLIAVIFFLLVETALQFERAVSEDEPADTAKKPRAATTL